MRLLKQKLSASFSVRRCVHSLSRGLLSSLDAEDGCPSALSLRLVLGQIPSMLRFKLLLLDLILSARILAARSVEVDDVAV